MICCIWVVALSSLIPWALYFQQVPLSRGSDIMMCIEVWPPGLDGTLYFLVANVFACYLVPMLLISLCYILIWIKVSKRSIPSDSKDAQMDRLQQKSKMKVVKMLIAVVILFVLSWLPLYLIFARIKFGKFSFYHFEIWKKWTLKLNLCRCRQTGNDFERRGIPTNRHAIGSVARLKQFVHQSMFVCIFQQEIPQRFCCYHSFPKLLHSFEILRKCGNCIVINKHPKIVALSKQKVSI